MSYHDTQCVCGGKKQTDTMLCPACEEYTRETVDRRILDDPACNTDAHRGAAIRLLAMARRRKSNRQKREVA